MRIRYLVVLAAAVFLGGAIFYSQDLGSYETFHRDEVRWIEISKFAFGNFFVFHDYSNPEWTVSYHGFGASSPNMVKYLIGFSLWMHGFREYHGMPRWDDTHTLEWKIQNGAVPSEYELGAARTPVAVLVLVSAAFLAILVILPFRGLPGLSASLGAAFIFLTNPIIKVMARRAMLDAPVASFGIIAAALTALALDKSLLESRWIRILLGLLAAVSAGMAVASKLNGGLVVIAVLAVALFNVVKERSLESAVFLVAAALVPALVFYVSDPSLWHGPAKGIGVMVDFGRLVEESRLTNPQVALWSATDRVLAFKRQVLDRHPILWLGVLAPVPLIRYRWKTLAHGIWAITLTTGTIAWTPIEFQRYYTMAVAGMAVLDGLTIGWLLSSMVSLARRVRVGSTASIPRQ